MKIKLDIEISDFFSKDGYFETMFKKYGVEDFSKKIEIINDNMYTNRQTMLDYLKQKNIYQNGNLRAFIFAKKIQK